jgi:hypothetical protein
LKRAFFLTQFLEKGVKNQVSTYHIPTYKGGKEGGAEGKRGRE